MEALSAAQALVGLPERHPVPVEFLGKLESASAHIDSEDIRPLLACCAEQHRQVPFRKPLTPVSVAAAVATGAVNATLNPLTRW